MLIDLVLTYIRYWLSTFTIDFDVMPVVLKIKTEEIAPVFGSNDKRCINALKLPVQRDTVPN